MTAPQAILSPLTEAAIFLTLVIEPGGEDGVRDVLTDVSGLRRSVSFRVPEGELTCVVGIGAAAWDRLFGEPRPAALHPFREVDGPAHRAPATPGDLLIHLRAHRLDMCFELAQLLTERLDGLARVIDEVHGFRSFDDRDLLGFVDGTENPEGEAAEAAVLIGDEDAAFAGGSYVVVQKYLPDERKPPDSHIALNTIVDDDGEERQIMRFNMPFGSVGTREFGTYFIGYANDPAVIEQMLQRMFLGKPPAAHDRILDFSTAVTGTLFFAPSLDLLDDPPAEPADDADAADDVAAPGPDSSLAIGSLKPKA